MRYYYSLKRFGDAVDAYLNHGQFRLPPLYSSTAQLDAEYEQEHSDLWLLDKSSSTARLDERGSCEFSNREEAMEEYEQQLWDAIADRMYNL